ncbi:uncharacterized protein LOC121877282 [Homarus americanus]|uniref:uncharacterized protein LOC121877282 n=1 Tax=Homarus americanus TaxID=6706 RepID=UPI001C441B3B|nr:uncharacterized protein LOC121877282 [Homarus americanus]
MQILQGQQILSNLAIRIRNTKTSSAIHFHANFLVYIYRHMEKRKTSLAVAFIDFTNAFDLGNHNLILNKAIDVGFRKSLIPWLTDFLSDRCQAVRFRGAVSTIQSLACGVPQGTEMELLCFPMLINVAL